MYEETVEKIARMMARDNDDDQHWGVYATRAMEIIETVHDVEDADIYELHHVLGIDFLS